MPTAPVLTVPALTMDAVRSPSTRSEAVAPASVYTLPASTVVAAEPLRVITGAVVSVTVTICVAVPMFPAASVADHVTVVVPTGNEAGALLVGVSMPSTTSTAVAIPRAIADNGPVASTDTAGGAVTTGGVASTRFTVTSCVAVAVFPAASLALYVTVVTPTGKVGGASLTTLTAPSTRSMAVAEPRTSATGWLSPELALTAAGAVIAGGVVSVMVTVWVAVALFPAVSVAVQVTTVVPTGKVAGALLLGVWRGQAFIT